MARKKLNKKVAFIGLIVLVMITVVAIAVFLSIGKDPEKFLADAEVALEQRDYKAAQKALGTAYNCSKSIEQKTSILFDLADLALISDPGDEEKEIEAKNPDWKKAVGYWKKVTLDDTKNIESREKILDFFYSMADTGQANAWDQVKETSNEMIEIYENKDEEPSVKILTARGRSSLEIAEQGNVSDIEEELKVAKTYLEQAKELDPENMDIYMYLARAEIAQGKIDDISGKINAIEKSQKRAIDAIQESIDLYPENPKGYINALRLKLSFDSSNPEKIDGLEQEYLALAEKFPNNAEVFSNIATYYQFNIKNLYKAVEMTEKALELDPQNMDYHKLAANTYYRYAAIFDKPEFIQEAVDIANAAMELPEAQETNGPEATRNANNRLILHTLLAKFYLEQANATQDKALKEEYITNAEDHIHEIEQIVGVGENRMVLKWKGLLELAKGNRDKAVVLLYNAYKKFDSTGRPDADLSYALAETYLNTPFLGSAQQFLNSALQANIVQQGKPDAVLQYANLLIEFQDPTNAIKLVEQYETLFGKTLETKAITAKAYIEGNFFEKASEIISTIEDETIKTQLQSKLAFSQLNQLRRMQATSDDGIDYNSKVKAKIAEIETLTKKLIELDDSQVDFGQVSALINNHISAGNIEAAKTLAEFYKKANPDDPSILIILKKLEQENPAQISQDKLKEITVEALSEVGDETQKAINLARYYQQIGEFENSIETLKPLLGNDELVSQVAPIVFDSAISNGDFETAEKMVDLASENNIDRCNGEFFAAKLNIAKENYKEAVVRCENCLKAQPIFPAVYATLSEAYEKTEKDEQALDAIIEAFKQNPLDKDIARQRASVLYNRNVKLGKTVTPSQVEETQKALVWAMKLDPANLNLQSIYAEYIYESDPRKALAIRQALQQNYPSAGNAMLLGNMAVKIAQSATSTDVQKAMLDIAESSYKEALALDPENKDVLNSYSEFLRLTGQEGEIEELLAGQEDVLWRAYIRSGKYDNAKAILDRLYKEEPKNVEVVKGLVLVAQRTSNKNDVIKYTNELISLENTADNKLAQIQAYIELGMTDQATSKIEDFKVNHPEETKVQLLEASLLIRKGLFEESLGAINMALEKNSSDPLALQLRAQINNLRGDYTSAINDLAKAKTLTDDGNVRIELAKAYARADRLDQAITELTIALDENEVPLNSLSLLEQFYIEKADNAKLQKFYEKTIAKYPDNSFWKNRLADLLVEEGKIDEALDIYQDNFTKSLQTSDYGDPQALMGYLNAFIKAERYSDAISFASKYVDGPYAVSIYSALGQAKAGLGDKATAVEYFTKSLEKAGINRNVISMVLNSASKFLSNEELEEIYTKMLNADPDSLNANMVGFIHQTNEKQFNKALKYIDNCIENADQETLKNSFEQAKADALQMAYNKMPDEKYLKEAIKIYKEQLEITPNNIALLNNMAYMLASNEMEMNNALEYAERAYAMAPASGTILDTYAFVLMKKGETQKALQLLLQTVQLFELGSISAPAEVYEHLGMTYEKLGKNEEALTAYQRAAENTDSIEGDSMKKRIQDAINRLSN